MQDNARKLKQTMKIEARRAQLQTTVRAIVELQHAYVALEERVRILTQLSERSLWGRLKWLVRGR